MKVACLALVCLLMGCSLVQERERRFMPAPAIPSTTVQLFIADCADALTNARVHNTDTNVIKLVDTCSAATAMNCGAWIDTNILAEHGIVMTDGTANAIGAGSTILAGVLDFTPGGVAAVGATQMLLHLFGQVEKTGLGAPEGFTAQDTLLRSLDTCSSALLTQAKSSNIGVAKAVIGLDRCRRLCTNGAASAITTQALTGVEVEAAPNGRLTVRRATQ